MDQPVPNGPRQLQVYSRRKFKESKEKGILEELDVTAAGIKETERTEGQMAEGAN